MRVLPGVLSALQSLTRQTSHRRLPFQGASLLAVALLCGCNLTKIVRKTDAETNGILVEKAAEVPGLAARQIHLSQRPVARLEDLAANEKNEDFLGDSARAEKGARIIPLAESLRMAVNRQPAYLSRKEELFLQALSLSVSRHRFSPIFTGSGGPKYQSTALADAAGKTVRENTLTTTGNLGFAKLQKIGTRIAATLSTDFLRALTGNLRSINESEFIATVAQPLLRGGGYLSTMEQLTQEERDLLYAVREFARYRQQFSIDVVTNYFRILEAKDAVRNAYAGLKSIQNSLERAQALMEAGRSSAGGGGSSVRSGGGSRGGGGGGGGSGELGQLKQATLTSELQWQSRLQSYQDLMDSFKTDLGLLQEDAVILDDRELGKLKLEEPSITPAQAGELALNTRLDLLNARDRCEDSLRKIKVARRGLLPGLDAVGTLTVPQKLSNGQPVTGLDFKRTGYSFGFDLDLPLDPKVPRQTYRIALLQREQAERQLGFSIEGVKRAIIGDQRELSQARREFSISDEGVKLSQSRLEEERLLSELGRGTVRDLLDAQNDLLDAQNDRTSALINHTLAKLRFWRDLGVLYINDDGAWVEALRSEAPSKS